MPSWEEGNPSFIAVLNADIINSLNNIIASDQKGIISILHSHSKGISKNILSVNGSIIAPNFVLRSNFLAKYPSKKSVIPPRIIKAKTNFVLFISKNIISGNVRNNRDIVKIFGIFSINFLIFLLWVNKTFSLINYILHFYHILGFNKILKIINTYPIEESLHFILLKYQG